MLQKTTTLAALAVLLAGAGTALVTASSSDQPARPRSDWVASTRGPVDTTRASRASAVPSVPGSTAIPAAPGGGGVPPALRAERPSLGVAIDEAVRELVLDAVHAAATAAGRRLRNDGFVPGDGVLRVANGRADLAIACREPTTGERDRGLVGERLGDLVAVIVVHPSNPVVDLEPREVRELVRGALASWHQVGGRNLPVRLVLPPPGPRSDLFARLLARGDTLSRAAEFAPSADERLRMVAGDPAAVTIVPLEAAERAHVGTVRIAGVPPGPGAVRAGRYPYATPVVLVHGGGADALRMADALREPRARRLLGAHLTLDPE